MNKFQMCLLIGSSILIILYLVGVTFDCVISTKRNKTYQKYVEVIQEQNLLLTEDINVTNKIIELLLQNESVSKNIDNERKGEERNEEND